MIIFIVLSLSLNAALTSDIVKWKIHEPIDLTWVVDEHSINWPGNKPFVYTRRIAGFNEQGNWYAMNEFCTAEHGGTHLDAPYHFNKHGWKVAEIPLQRLLTHAIVVDMSEIVNRLGPTVELEEGDLIDWERIHGPMPPHCVVLVRFGWSVYYKSKETYLGINGTNLTFPGISEKAAQWLVNSNKIVGVGVDTASIDSGSSTTFAAHRILAEHNIYLLENLMIPRKLPARGFNLVIMPMKLKEGSGSPTRAVAIPSIILTTGTECNPMGFTSNNVPWYGHTSVVLSSLLLLAMYTINCFTL